MTTFAPEAPWFNNEVVVLDMKDGDQFIGVVHVDDEQQVVFVSTGYSGRPRWFAVEDIEEITPASAHPDVDG
ncbi:MAG: hypothetical protein NVS3B1_29550 [Marmoricola sp.]